MKRTFHLAGEVRPKLPSIALGKGLLLATGAVLATLPAHAQSTAFAYQGRILDGTTMTVFVISPTGNHRYRLFKP